MHVIMTVKYSKRLNPFEVKCTPLFLTTLLAFTTEYDWSSFEQLLPSDDPTEVVEQKKASKHYTLLCFVAMNYYLQTKLAIFHWFAVTDQNSRQHTQLSCSYLLPIYQCYLTIIISFVFLERWSKHWHIFCALYIHFSLIIDIQLLCQFFP